MGGAGSGWGLSVLSLGCARSEVSTDCQAGLVSSSWRLHIRRFREMMGSLVGYGSQHLLNSLCPRQSSHGRGRGLLLFTPPSF